MEKQSTFSNAVESRVASTTAGRRRFSPTTVCFWAVLAISAHLQFTAVFETEVIVPVVADAVDYVSYAYNLENHGVYSRQPTWRPDWQGGPPAPDAVRTPGYPVFLGALMESGPTATFVAKVEVVQAAMAVATVALSFFLARLFLAPAWACACALLVAITPQLVTASTYLLSEGLFSLALIAGLLCLAGARRSSSPAVARIVASGLLLSAAALVRPTLLYAPIVLLPVLWMQVDRASRTRAVLGFALAFTAVQAPWMIRNEVTLGRATDQTLTIATLQHGSYPGFLYQDRPETYGTPYRFDPRTPDVTRSTGAVLRHIAAEFVARPLRMTSWYLFEKPFYFFSWEPIQGMGDVFIYQVRTSPYFSSPEFTASKAAMQVLHWPLVALGFVGAILPWLRSRHFGQAGWQLSALRLLSALMFFVLAVHMVGAPFPRYSVPFRPLTWLFALLALHTGWLAWLSRRRMHDVSGSRASLDMEVSPRHTSPARTGAGLAPAGITATTHRPGDSR